MSLITVGTMAFDAIETPFAKVDKIVGGSATYVAYAAINFVKPVQQISIVGNDFPLEEMNELNAELVKGNTDAIESEFGDVLFSLINYARFIKVNPENALERTNKKFIGRFQFLENEAKKLNKSLHDMSLAEMDVFWNEAKKLDK